MKDVNFDQFTNNTFVHEKDLVLWREEKIDTFSQSYLLLQTETSKRTLLIFALWVRVWKIGVSAQ